MITKSAGWYVTKVIGSPDVLLDGPFSTRDACIKRCIERSSELTIARAYTTKNVILLYTPRYVHA